MKRKLNLQLFAEEAAAVTETVETATETAQTETKSAEPKTYTDAEVDKIIDRKFAEWQKKQQKAVDEAKKLAEMNATQKAEYERDQLQKELDELKRKDALSEMSKTARKMLADNGINISDDLLSMMVTTEAAETKTAIDSFVKMYKESVESAVKERLRGDLPKRSSASDTPITEIEKRIKKYS